MISEGDIVLFQFAQTDQNISKLRPVLLIKRIRAEYRDWLVCMISTKIHQFIEDLDIVINEEDEDFHSSGLKTHSVLRISRVAVVDEKIFEGRLGSIAGRRLRDVKERFSNWLLKE